MTEKERIMKTIIELSDNAGFGFWLTAGSDWYNSACEYEYQTMLNGKVAGPFASRDGASKAYSNISARVNHLTEMADRGQPPMPIAEFMIQHQK